MHYYRLQLDDTRHDILIRLARQLHLEPGQTLNLAVNLLDHLLQADGIFLRTDGILRPLIIETPDDEKKGG